MLKDKDYWMPILKRFAEDYPDLFEKCVDWYPSAQLQITIRLEDDTRYSYDFLNHNLNRLDITLDEIGSEDAYKKQFAKNFNKKMRNMGYSQQCVSERSGIMQSMISKYSTGKSIPNGYNIKRLARALKCSVDELLV